jgi:Holliday junction resolvasome RuvABC endonuclease subunit
MKILALDLATKTGWATDTASGVWNLATNKGESYGMKLIRFKAKVKEVIELEDTKIVAYEKPTGAFPKAISSVSEMVGVLILLCEEMGVEHTGHTVAEIKKHATGKGNAGKPEMVHAAEIKWPEIRIIDDNHADALHILDFTKKTLNVE